MGDLRPPRSSADYIRAPSAGRAFDDALGHQHAVGRADNIPADPQGLRLLGQDEPGAGRQRS